MKVQSLSIVVPNNKCINNCKFCVSNMHKKDIYDNMWKPKNLYWDLYEKDFLERLEYARDNGCNTLMLTGDSEPQQNWEFLKTFGTLNKWALKNPFKNIEMQTTGVLLDNDYLYFLRHHVGVTTISLSISSFSSELNADYNGTKESLKVQIKELCKKIKKYKFNLRLSINLTDSFNLYIGEDFFKIIEFFQADQVTFRVLYSTPEDLPQNKWIEDHRCKEEVVTNLKSYIKEKGKFLEVLEFGAKRYSVNGISTVLDQDCMSTEAKDSLKYLILRPDCKLYSKWDDKGSLIF